MQSGVEQQWKKPMKIILTVCYDEKTIYFNNTTDYYGFTYHDEFNTSADDTNLVGKKL